MLNPNRTTYHKSSYSVNLHVTLKLQIITHIYVSQVIKKLHTARHYEKPYSFHGNCREAVFGLKFCGKSTHFPDVAHERTEVQQHKCYRMHTADSKKNITAFDKYRDKVFSTSHYP
jgi:hypothetical protein